MDRESVLTLQAHTQPLDPASAESLERPITAEEVITAIRSGAKHESPGINSICHEFYSANWEMVHLDLLELLNHMFLSNNVTPRQKHGVLICIPETDGDGTPNGYHPISLLNTDYKILVRILGLRLRQVMAAHLQHTQFCGVPGHSILDAASQIRDMIAHAENTGTPMCILSLDFHNAFDCIAHDNMFHILQSYSIWLEFIDLLHAMYSDTTVSVQINDTIAGTILIQSGVRQGCPLSMVLYALCLHHLLSMLDHSLQGLQVGRGKGWRPVLAYADDVTIFVTHPVESATTRQAIHCFEKVTGAQLNPSKSKAMALGGWTALATELVH